MGTNYYLQSTHGDDAYDSWPVASLDEQAGIAFHPVYKLIAYDLYDAYGDNPPHVGSVRDIHDVLTLSDEYELVLDGDCLETTLTGYADSLRLLDAVLGIANEHKGAIEEPCWDEDYLDPQGYLFKKPESVWADIYLRRARPRMVYEQIHLCKCSWGWRTTWQASALVRSVADARALIESGRYVVMDEYGNIDDDREASLARIDKLCRWCADGRDSAKETGCRAHIDAQGYPFVPYDFY